MRFGFIKSLAGGHPLSLICLLLGVSRQGYHAWLNRPRSQRELGDRFLMKKIAWIWERSHRIYGSPRVWAELRAEHGIRCSRKRVERLMRQLGIKGKGRSWRRRSLTKRDRNRSPSPDLVRRRFKADRPNQLWLADISQVETSEGWLYLAAVLDQCSRRVVGWSMRRLLRPGVRS